MSLFPCDCAPLGESRPPSGFVFPPEGPVNPWRLCLGLVLAVIREHAWGAETSYIVRVTGLESEHAESALAHLRSQGYVNAAKQTISWYYGHRRVSLWREAFRADLLGQALPRFTPTREEGDGIPPQFWWLFWSGMDPMFLRLSQHALYIASRMIAPEGSRRSLPAEVWALDCIPTGTLSELAEVRGYRGSASGDRIRRRVSERERESPHDRLAPDQRRDRGTSCLRDQASSRG